MYHQESQTAGNIAHKTIDTGTYSTKKYILQAMSVHSREYGISGKIDIFNSLTGTLTERKKKIEKVYYGYKLQLFGQYLCLSEMGYIVEEMRLHSLDDNKIYPVLFPSVDELISFRKLLRDFRDFQLNGAFQPNPLKCQRCVYRTLCDKSPL